MSLPDASHSRVDEDRSRSDAIYGDASCQSYIIMAMEHYSASLRQSLKHVYHALPRLLSLWFELAAIQVPAGEKADTTEKSNKRQIVAFGSRRGSKSAASTPGEAESYSIEM